MLNMSRLTKVFCFIAILSSTIFFIKISLQLEQRSIKNIEPAVAVAAPITENPQLRNFNEQQQNVEKLRQKRHKYLEHSVAEYAKRREKKLKEIHPPEESTKRKSCDGKEVVPRIVHFTWFRNSSTPSMPFAFKYYLSVLSAVRFVKPRTIMFWHSSEVTGPWWNALTEKLASLETPVCLEMMKILPPTSIFNNTVKVPEHQSDIVRLEALLKYGGVYADLDVIFVRPIDELLCYDVTMDYEIKEALCNCVIIAAPGAEFLRLWYDAYRTFNDKKWADHSLYVPGALTRKHPELIHIEFYRLCHPYWGQEEVWHLFDGYSSFDWRSYSYAVHFWARAAKVLEHLLASPETIAKLDNTAGEILRYIYLEFN